MKNYIPPYQITDEILMHVSSISDKIGQITQRNGLEAKPHLRKNNKIRSIHSSLHIEANSLSLNEVKDVINGKLVLGAAAEIQEVKNAYAAYDEISVVNPYQIEELKRIHGVMTKYLVEESGQFRRHEEGVFDGERCIFMAPPAQFVPELMQELFDWMNANKDTVHPLIMSAVFHLSIHFQMVMEEWHDFGIPLFWQNGNQYLSIFLLKVRLKNFRRNIIRQLRNVIRMEAVHDLLHLC